MPYFFEGNYDDALAMFNSAQFGLASLRMGRRLQEGFVITDEPGCYFIPALIDKWKAEKMHTDFLNFDAIEKFKDFGPTVRASMLVATARGNMAFAPKEVSISSSSVLRDSRSARPGPRCAVKSPPP